MSSDFASFISQLENEVKSLPSSTSQNTIVTPAGSVGSTSSVTAASSYPSMSTPFSTSSLGEVPKPSFMSSTTSASVPAGDKKLKLMIVSTHIHQTTGYSKVSYGLLQYLSKIPWLEVVQYAIQNIRSALVQERSYPPNIKVIDALANEKQQQNGFGFAELPAFLKEEKPHILMIYNDVSVMSTYLEQIRKANIEKTYKLWIYFDQVYPMQNPAMLEIVNRDADRYFCFTNEWKDVLKRQKVTRPIDVMTHVFESKIFAPIPREIARQSLKIPNDAFVYFSLNRNQPRKRQDLLIMAFVELITKYPQRPIYMLLVCDNGVKGGYPIFDIYARELQLRNVPIEQFGNRLMLSSNDMNFKDIDINLMYCATDVGVSCAEGEGFGLCAFEQMGVGVPQVLTDVVGHREYANKNNSILVPTKIRAYVTISSCNIGGEINLVDYLDFAKGMEMYLLNDDLRKRHGKQAREDVLKYTWDNATNMFMKRLKSAHDELCEDGELS